MRPGLEEGLVRAGGGVGQYTVYSVYIVVESLVGKQPEHQESKEI